MVNGRQELKWDTFPVKPVPFAVDQARTQEFEATATPTESGTSYVEVWVTIANPCLYAPCLIPGDPGKGYSWQSGPVIVPAYDVRSELPQSMGWGNSIPGGLGVSLESWHVQNKK